MWKPPELPEPPGVYLYRSAGHRHECVELGYWNSALPFPRPALRAQCRLRSGSRRPVTRRRIEIVPPEKKDAAYVSKRLKDNEAAKRSGEKQKMKNLLLEGQLLALRNENAIFQDEVLRLRYLSMCASQDKAAPARDLCAVYSPAVSKAPIWWEEERSDAGIIRSFGWAPGFDSRPQSSALRPPLRPGFLLLWQGWRGQWERPRLLSARSPSALTRLPLQPFCPGLTHSTMPPCFHTARHPGRCPGRQWPVFLRLPCWLPRPSTPTCPPACRRHTARASAWRETSPPRSGAAFTAR